MVDTLPSQVEANPRVPVEVCERVIEAVYDNRYFLVKSALATLSSCALVCRAWRPPAQMVLFDYVIIRDKNALHNFAELLDASPELGSYVRALDLRGYLHVPYSPVALFPTVLRGRLTKLSALYINEYNADEKDATPLPDGVKQLPSLPIHRYLPSMLTCISLIRRLDLYHVVFPSFGDFARILDALPDLRELYCVGVSWVVLGKEPLCMPDRRSHDFQNRFLPELESLQCIDMDVHGWQRILAALGPSLQELVLKVPNGPPSLDTKSSAVEEQEPSLTVDLQSFPHFYFYVAPFPRPPESTLASLRDTLVSWATPDEGELGGKRASQRQQQIYLRPYRSLFKREGLVDLLRAIGPIVEASLCSMEHPGDLGNDAGGQTESQTDPCMATVIVQDLGDRLEWADWWRTRMQECFPTFAKWNRLQVYPSHTELPDVHWIDYEQTPAGLARFDSFAILPFATQESIGADTED